MYKQAQKDGSLLFLFIYFALLLGLLKVMYDLMRLFNAF